MDGWFHELPRRQLACGLGDEGGLREYGYGRKNLEVYRPESIHLFQFAYTIARFKQRELGNWRLGQAPPPPFPTHSAVQPYEVLCGRV